MNQREDDVVDRSGNAIVSLLQQAADLTNADYDRAMQTASALSGQLRACQDRVSQLEGDVAIMEERALRAEQWLDKVRGEIEHKFLHPDEARKVQAR